MGWLVSCSESMRESWVFEKEILQIEVPSIHVVSDFGSIRVKAKEMDKH